MEIPIRNGSVKLAGTEMYYARFGHGEKILTVLPGLSDGLATVKGLAMVLAAPYRKHFDSHTIYMFSRRNDIPEGYSIQDMAADQLTALKLLGIEKTSVLGVSQGGMIAQYMAILAPDTVEKLVLAVTAPACNETTRARVLHWLELVERKDHKQLMIDTAECSYSPAYLARYRMAYPVLGLVSRPKSYERFIRNAEAILSFDAAAELNRIVCPTFILGGQLDQIVGIEASYRLHDLIHGSRLYVYPDIGHSPYEEDKEFYDRVFAFLNEEV